MAIVSKGTPIIQMYRDFKEGKFIVNRRYQRKLVWTLDEKRNLIDSILNQYPIPLILLAETKDGKYEVIDGMQRLNAIFTFIDNGYPLNDDRYFDIESFITARNYHGGDNYTKEKDINYITSKECADITEYQLAVTTFSLDDDAAVTDIFGRINSSGRQLSNQEKRQAGVDSLFSNFIRKLSSKHRQDNSDDIVEFSEMPSISVDGIKKSEKQGYGIQAEDTFWVSQGIINSKDLRDSVDEQILADLAASILLAEPFASSKETLDELYDKQSTVAKRVETKLIAYPESKLETEINTTFSAILQVLDSTPNKKYAFKDMIYNGKRSSSSRTAFYAVFMAFYKLVVKEEQEPKELNKITNSLTDLANKLTSERHHVTSEDRTNNINLTYGLISSYFIKANPSLVGRSNGLLVDFRDLLSRSRAESKCIELKQGIVNLDHKAKINTKLVEKKIPEIICSMANIGPHFGEGHIFIGVADSKEDAAKITEIYDEDPIICTDRYIFGIERECAKQKISIEDYIGKIINGIQNSELSDALKHDVLMNIEHFQYQDRTIIWIKVLEQKELSWIGEETFIRIDSDSLPANLKQTAEMTTRFLNG